MDRSLRSSCMKLLMISGDRSILQGKKGAFFYTLQEFSKHWERIDIICPRVPLPRPLREHPSPDGGGVGGGGIFPNVHFHPNPGGLLSQPFWILKKGRELVALCRHDVMTVHDYPPFYNGLGARWLHKKIDIPYAEEIHHIVGFPAAASLQELIGRTLSWWMVPFVSKKAAAVRVVSSQTEEKLEKWGIAKSKMEIIPSFYLDHELLKPSHTTKQQYDVVVCGRLVENKGFFEVLEAMSLIPGSSILIIGDGPLRNKLERKARELNLQATFSGWLPTNKDVYENLQKGRVFVMNSKSEGGPRVLLEAMALGIAVVATNVGVATNAIGETGSSGLITSGEPKDLASKIKFLLDHPDRRKAMGIEGQVVLRLFGKEHTIETYYNFLKEIASSGSSQSSISSTSSV